MDWKKFVTGNTTSHNNVEEKHEQTDELESLDSFEENQELDRRISKSFYIHKDRLIHKSSNKRYINTAEFKHYYDKHSSPANPVMFLDEITQVKYELTMLTKWTPICNGLLIIDSKNVHFISLGKRMTLEVMPIDKISAVEDELNILKIYIGSRKLTFKTSMRTVKLIREHIQNLKMN
ncbi:hypothetical protein LNK15_03010 [Jeotgalicoccus huakuii]|nr:hypothetical protein [Jeotgalicoccus huakuii]